MLFFRQLFALCVKNWIILAKHPVVTTLRCLIAPIGCGVILAYAQFFLSRPSNDGIGTMVPVAVLGDTFDGTLKLPWSDNTGGVGTPTPAEIMARVAQGFSSKQRGAIMRVDSSQIGNLCQQNFNGVSDCFASVIFEASPEPGSNATFNYTIRADQHLTFIDVVHHTSDFELRILRLYVAQERRFSVQAMQFSNGLSNPAGLWLGHLMFDSIFSIASASILVGVFSATSTLFHGLGYLWLVSVLYGLTGTLLAYCFSLFIASPLAAFASAAIYQVVIVALYIVAYFLTFTYGKVAFVGRDLDVIHFTVSLISPVCNVLRAAFVSINLFSLLCKGSEAVGASALGDVTHFGGPALYLILDGVLLLLFLAWIDSGSSWRPTLSALFAPKPRLHPSALPLAPPRPDVAKEAEDAVRAEDAALRVLNVSKTFGANKAVDSVSFAVRRGTIFALIGPNGAGKTTTFNVIRGDVRPDHGDVLVNGRSVTRRTRAAREALGVCPQFSAIEARLTVREHLALYARLKGVPRGAETARDVDATGLDAYVDRMATALSGGNQRKLALAIALMGDPSVILIDEFSTGIDARTKREMWGTLKRVCAGKAVVITTHSMEEAATLADKVGILARRMLAVGTLDALVDRYATYVVHFAGRSRADVVRAQAVMACIPGARMADDVATRFEVPVVAPAAAGGTAGERRGMSLAELFGLLAEAGAGEYAVEEASLESVFMKVIQENGAVEDERRARADGQRWWGMC